jgi:hypothetical protein
MYANSNAQSLNLTMKMLRLERKALRLSRRYANEFLNAFLIVGFSFYWSLKFLMRLGWLLLEAPRLREQIKPGLYREASNEHIKPQIYIR